MFEVMGCRWERMVKLMCGIIPTNLCNALKGLSAVNGEDD
jgi:hypothetical protein